MRVTGGRGARGEVNLQAMRILTGAHHALPAREHSVDRRVLSARTSYASQRLAD